MTSSTAIIYCHLRLKLKVSFSEYKKIAEWLGTYKYEVPAERKVLPELGIALATYFQGNLTEAWHRYYNCEHFTEQVQREIIQWLQFSDQR